MDDLSKRLRDEALEAEFEYGGTKRHRLMHEAADALDARDAEVGRHRAALERIMVIWGEESDNRKALRGIVAVAGDALDKASNETQA